MQDASHEIATLGDTRALRCKTASLQE